jgi:hypothetical protein
LAQDRAKHHREAAARHRVSAVRHDDTARRWAERDDTARADFHKRVAEIERELAQLHADMVEVEERRGV